MGKPRGRPAKGIKTVVYYRRVVPDAVSELDVIVERFKDQGGALKAKAIPSHGLVDESPYKAQIRALLDDVERLEAEKEKLTARIKELTEMPVEERTRLLIGRIRELESVIRKYESNDS